MSENNELFKGVPTPKSAAAASTDTGSVKKVEAEADDTRTRKTVKLSAAGMMPNLNNPVGRLKPEDLAVPPREVPPAAATEKPADSPTIRLRPQAPMPKVPGAAPAAAPASTDTGSVKKVDAEADDTRTRRTVRISAASVERRPGGMPMPSAGIPTPPPAAPAASENKPKLTMPTPAPKPTISAPKPAAPAPAPAPAAASAPTAPAEKPAEAEAPAAEAAAGGRRGRKKSGGLNLVKDEAAKAGPSRVANDMAQISGKSAGSSEASPVYTVLAIITVLALIGTLVLSSQYLNVWSPEWAAGFTLLK